MTTERQQIDIRTATAADLPEVHRMMIALAAHHGDQATITPAGFRTLTLDNPAARLLVARPAGSPVPHPVAYALILGWQDPATGRITHEIANLFVQAPFRRQGYARALVVAAGGLVDTEGGASLTVGAVEGNGPAATVCREMGMARVAEARFIVEPA
ncbi:hypothetical protein E7811_05420 [Aliigemmobacter aestuarii]|uniref:N-acetyltransferase domain-containing protein n=1 Tax=Aliigemmobacter aestuarii TaxID=1445661 RepID=A0A4V6RS35_9RHOB|nr:GNAT family N-acetyltransferase [Gemmobacter aestuarii]THD85152.1 hypothetical protein E7811_05420 [Gemmobacter aestuarii]